MENLKKEIEQLKQEKNAALLAHYYVDDAVRKLLIMLGILIILPKLH